MGFKPVAYEYKEGNLFNQTGRQDLHQIKAAKNPANKNFNYISMFTIIVLSIIFAALGLTVKVADQMDAVEGIQKI